MTTKGDEMSKDLLVLADEYAAATATFARALALKDGADSMSPIARDAGDKRAVLAEAIAALDTAQPVQVNAMLLTAAMDLRHALSNVLQRIPSDEWPKWLAVRDEADKMIAAAKQTQPPAPSDAARKYMTGYSDGREWAKSSQALGLTDDEIDALLPTITLKGLDPKQQVWLTKKDAIAFARAIIAAIKQGGQHD